MYSSTGYLLSLYKELVVVEVEVALGFKAWQHLEAVVEVRTCLQAERQSRRSDCSMPP